MKTYRYTRKDLFEIYSEIIGLVTKYKDEFLNFGINEERINGLINKSEIVRNTETDDELKASQVRVSDNKRKLENIIRIALYRLQAKIEIEFKYSKPEIYNNFRIKNLSQLQNNKLYAAASNFLDYALKNRDILNQTLISDNDLTEFQQNLSELEGVLNNFSTAKRNRKTSTALRKKVYDELYEELNYFAKVGKAIWFDKSHALHKHFQLHRGKFNKGKNKQLNTEE